ncbi:MAG: hypothetical protein M3O70_22605 [Actinomycetota bacterium]|nr:hypothetical protein [Actinomycetota bacterium]
MRIESSVTSISWIPSEVLSAFTGLPFELGVFHYDAPPPERVADGDLQALYEADRLRFANELRAFVEVDDGRIIDHGHLGRGLMGWTTLRLGRGSRTIPGVLLPVLRNVEVTDASVRFVQTVGGRTGVLAPRPVNRPPYVQLIAPTVWTTLALTLHADGRSEYELVRASSMPRHWIYDGDGQVTHKSGVIDANGWAVSHSLRSPWADYDAPAVVAEVETALERNLSTAIMRAGEQPKIRKLRAGDTLTEQGT